MLENTTEKQPMASRWWQGRPKTSLLPIQPKNQLTNPKLKWSPRKGRTTVPKLWHWSTDTEISITTTPLVSLIEKIFHFCNGISMFNSVEKWKLKRRHYVITSITLYSLILFSNFPVSIPYFNLIVLQISSTFCTDPFGVSATRKSLTHFSALYFLYAIYKR